MDVLSRHWPTLLRDPSAHLRVADHGDRIVIEGQAAPPEARLAVLAPLLIAIMTLVCLAWLWPRLDAGLATVFALVAATSVIFAAMVRRLWRRAIVLEPEAMTLEEGRLLGSARRRIAYRDIHAIDVCDESDTPLGRQHGLLSIGRYHVAIWHGPFRLRTLSAGDPDAAERIQQGIIAAIGEVRMRANKPMAATHTA